MTKLLVLKEQLKRFYGKFDIYIIAVLKFAAGLLAVSMINANVGYMGKLKNMAVVLILSLLCSVLPVGGMVLICACVILAHFYTISLELAAVTFILFFIMFCLYIRFDTKLGYIILLTPILFWLKIPYLMPLIAGLTGGMIAAVPVGMGVIVYYLLAYVKINAPLLSNSTMDNMVEKLTMVIDGMLNNKLMFLTAAAFMLTVAIVYLIKSLSVDYSWTIAVGVGTVVNMLVLLVGDFSLDVTQSVLGIIVGSLVSAAIMLLLQYFVFAVDYTRTERVQFEDDDYVYYVKAVPKMSVTSPEVNVKRINAQRTKRNS